MKHSNEQLDIWTEPGAQIDSNHTSTQTNRKSKFDCIACGVTTDAPVDTKRFSARLCRDCFGKKEDKRSNQLNDLSGREWAQLSKSVEHYNGIRSEKQKLHGAAFPVSLVEAQIQIYSKAGETIFDPFLGVGTTSQAAERLNRKSIGIEINPEFVNLALQDIYDRQNHQVIQADVRDMLMHIKPDSIDFQITSPPYANLLKAVKGNFAFKWREHSTLNVVPNPKPYSSHEADMGNLSYDEFMQEMIMVFKNTQIVLKNEHYAAWVVKDFRNLSKGVPFVNFHGDIIECATIAGLTLWDIRIYDQTKFRPLVVLGYPSRNYYLNIGHSYILIFKKC